MQSVYLHLVVSCFCVRVCVCVKLFTNITCNCAPNGLASIGFRAITCMELNLVNQRHFLSFELFPRQFEIVCWQYVNEKALPVCNLLRKQNRRCRGSGETSTSYITRVNFIAFRFTRQVNGFVNATFDVNYHQNCTTQHMDERGGLGALLDIWNGGWYLANTQRELGLTPASTPLARRQKFPIRL